MSWLTKLDPQIFQDSSKRVISSSQRPLPVQHTTNTRGEHPCHQWDSNSLSQQWTAAQPSLRPHDRQDSHHFISLTQSKFAFENGALCYRLSFSRFCNSMCEGIGQSFRLDILFQELTSLFPILNCWLMVTKQRKPHYV